MGKGDRKTAKGKRYVSSYGNARKQVVAKAGVAATEKAGAATVVLDEADTELPAGKYVFYMLGWAGLPTIDVYNIMTATMATPKGDMGAWNPNGFSDARVDELIPLIGAEYDPEKRQAMISEVMPGIGSSRAG